MSARQNPITGLAETLNAGRIPLWLKLAYSAFMVVLIPVYWVNYGPSNFLYFCDTALILTLIVLYGTTALSFP